MKTVKIVFMCTILLSLLIANATALDISDQKRVDIDSNSKFEIKQEEDLISDDFEYDYEEVVGEDVPKNIIPFQKHPGVYVIDLEGILYALDAETGEILWAKKVSDKLIKVTEAPPPPMNYGQPVNGTSLQPHFMKPFNELIVTLDGYILFPNMDGKFSVFQHSIDSIIDQDTITFQFPGLGDDSSILLMGGKKSSFFSLDEVSGKYSSFGSEKPDPRIKLIPSLSEVRVIRVEKNVNCLSYRGFEYWNLTTNTLSLQFSNEIMRHVHEISSISELDYLDSFSIQALGAGGSVKWKRRFPNLLIQAYYANNDNFVFVKNSRTISTTTSFEESSYFITKDEEIQNHILLALLHSPSLQPNVPLLDHVDAGDAGDAEDSIGHETKNVTLWPVVERNSSTIEIHLDVKKPNDLSFYEKLFILVFTSVFIVGMYFLFKWIESYYADPSESGLEVSPISLTTNPLQTSTIIPPSQLSVLSPRSSQSEERENITDIAFIPFNNGNITVRNGLYQQEFEEKSLLGTGGFGAVFLSQRKLEGVDYAVKKTILLFKSPNQEVFKKQDWIKLCRVLREVRNFAGLDHPNLVRFYTSWLEFVPLKKLKQEVPISFDDLYLSSNDTTSEFESFAQQLMTQEFSAAISQFGGLVSLQTANKFKVDSISDILDETPLESINWNETPKQCPFVFESQTSLFDKDIVDSSSDHSLQDASIFPISESSSSSTSSATSASSTSSSSSSASTSSTSSATSTSSLSESSSVNDETVDLSSKVLSSQMDFSLQSQVPVEDDKDDEDNNSSFDDLSFIDQDFPNEETSNHLKSNTNKETSNHLKSNTNKETSNHLKSTNKETSNHLKSNTNKETSNHLKSNSSENSQDTSALNYFLYNPQFNNIFKEYAAVLFLQMNYCGKRTLSDYLQIPTRVVDEEENLNITIQLCQGLNYLHTKGIIHRDIKPANIFYLEDGTIRLGDFGLSRNLSDIDNDINSHTNINSTSATSETTTCVGTRLYSSPEQFNSKTTYNFKSDIFAAGLVLYELSLPCFKTNSERFMELDKPKHGIFPDSLSNISNEFCRLLKRMLDVDPEKRPTAEEVEEEAKIIMRGQLMIIQLSKELPFASQQLGITSFVQNLEISKNIKLIKYEEKLYQIHVTIMKLANEQLEKDMESIRSLSGVISVTLTV